MRPKERRETGQTDPLRSRLDAIINMSHPLVKLARDQLGLRGFAVRRGEEGIKKSAPREVRGADSYLL